MNRDKYRPELPALLIMQQDMPTPIAAAWETARRPTREVIIINTSPPVPSRQHWQVRRHLSRQIMSL
eukprot:7289-Eustigmatos_ZCMA.PRE.1